MLTRLKFKRDYKSFVRCLSEKPPEKDGNLQNRKEKDERLQKDSSKAESQTEKIQSLLKSMMAAPKINDKEYKEKFTTAPEKPKTKREKAEGILNKGQLLEQNLTKAAESIAQAVGGDVKQTEAELLSKVLGKINQSSTSLSDLIIGMKVDRSKETDDGVKRETRGQQVKRLVDRARMDPQKTRYNQRKEQDFARKEITRKSSQQATIVNILSGEPLGIFKSADGNYGTKLDMWESLNERELTLATLQPPANYYQKMIQWTEQGKIWQFPINNEQGLEEELNVHFSEHIFLDSHLEDWCPKHGPIRHFMELVCVGLSKNPFYTVQEKKDHIMWYKEYFESKQDVLTEVGVWNVKPGGQKASV